MSVGALKHCTYRSSPKILPEPLTLYVQWFAILQAEDHPSPLRIRGISPCVHSRSLHHDITPAHELRLAAVQHALDLPFEHDAVIHALSAVHHAGVSRCEIHVSQHRSTTAHKPKLARFDLLLVCPHVGIVVEIGRERGRESYAHAQLVFVIFLPVDWASRVDDGFASVLIVAGEIGCGTWQVLRELVRSRLPVGHCVDCFRTARAKDGYIFEGVSKVFELMCSCRNELRVQCLVK